MAVPTSSRSDERRLQLLASALEQVETAIAIAAVSFDERPRLTYGNHAFQMLTGIARDAVGGHPVDQVGVLPAQSRASLCSAISARGAFACDTTLLREDGDRIDVQLRVTTLDATHSLLSVDEARDGRVWAAAVERQAFCDELTHLPNRASLMRRLDESLSAGKRHGRTALLLLDLDNFKEINDTFGHQWGDRVLCAVSRRFRRVVRPNRTLARLGGDEFALVIAGFRSKRDVVRAAHALWDALVAPFNVDGHSLAVGASIGIALSPDHGLDAPTLVRRADVAMYTAKGARRGIAVYDPRDDRHSPERLTLMTDLRRAISANELALQYQPKVYLTTGAIKSVEALVRWNHPFLGAVPPDEFIRLAEPTGVIRPLTDWVLNRVLEQCRAWLDRGNRVRMAVNLSPRMLQEADLPEVVLDSLARHRVDPRLLELEITEGSVMEDLDRSVAVLRRLRNAGVGVSIDDFGTGYSSLGAIRHLEVDEIKIDKSFVAGMLTNNGDAAIVRATISLCHTLGLRVVAEGVEHYAQYRRLRELGCDLAQGFHISRPVGAAPFLAWATARDWKFVADFDP